MKLKLLLCAALAFFAFGTSAQAQTPVVVQCSVNNPINPWVPCSSGNPLPVSASVTASIAPFLPSASGSRGTQFTVNTTTTAQTLPTGAAVVVSNEGTTNTMYCNAVGASATTADQPISPNGGWFVFGTANAGGSINCIASGGTTTANMVGGGGLPAGTGGGSGGGGGGTVTQGNAGSALSAWYVQPGTSAVFPASQSGSWTVTANAGTNLNTSALATSANQTNKNQFVQLTDGTNAATTYTSYGTAPTGNVPGVNAFVTNANANGAAAPASASPVTPSNLPVGGGSWAATQVSVGSTATQILAARTGVAGTGRICATIENTSTVAVYLGGSGVTTSTGALLPGILGAAYTVCTTAAIYGIVATGTETVTASETF